MASKNTKNSAAVKEAVVSADAGVLEEPMVDPITDPIPMEPLGWEYKCYTSQPNQTMQQCMSLLNKLGADGWEAYTFWTIQDPGAKSLQFMWQLKRMVAR